MGYFLSVYDQELIKVHRFTPRSKAISNVKYNELVRVAALDDGKNVFEFARSISVTLVYGALLRRQRSSAILRESVLAG